MKDLEERIIVALDTSDVGQALEIVEQLDDLGCKFKIGLELMTTILARMFAYANPENGVQNSESAKFYDNLYGLVGKIAGRTMWDGKFLDIGNTVSGAVNALGLVSPWAFTVHSTGSSSMIDKAVAHRGASKLLGITVLTDMSECDSLNSYRRVPEQAVVEFAEQLAVHGADGIVCSGEEVSILRQNRDLDRLMLVVPGTRPSWAKKDDQKRVTSPARAIREGATCLVFGRPICSPTNGMSPREAAESILEEMRTA